MRSAVALLLSLAMVCAPPRSSAGGDPVAFDQLYDRLQGVERALFASHSSREIGRRLTEAFADGFGKALSARGLQALSDEELRPLLRAWYLVAAQARAAQQLEGFQATLAEMDRRGIAMPADFVLQYGLLVMFRRLDEARIVAERHPELRLEPVPPVENVATVVSKGATVLVIEEAGARLRKAAVEFGRGRVLVAMVHPRCAFSRAAMEQIQSRRQLLDRFDEVIWIAPIDSRLDLATLLRWNADHPQARIELPVSWEEWPFIETWETPSFFQLQSGVPVATHAGWPRESGLEDFERFLRSVE